MASLDQLRPEVASVITGAPSFRIERELTDAAYDFCRQSGIWRETLPAVPAQDGVAEYDFTAPTGARVDKVLWAYYGRNALTSATPDVLREANHRANSSGNPSRYALVRGSSNGFVVNPVPGADQTDDFTFHGLLVPTRDATDFPDWLVTEWQDALVNGAIARLLKASAEWANPALAREYRRDFQQEVVTAKREAITGHGADVAVRVPKKYP